MARNRRRDDYPFIIDFSKDPQRYDPDTILSRCQHFGKRDSPTNYTVTVLVDEVYLVDLMKYESMEQLVDSHILILHEDNTVERAEISSVGDPHILESSTDTLSMTVDVEFHFAEEEESTA
jgi:hypothetical protein